MLELGVEFVFRRAVLCPDRFFGDVVLARVVLSDCNEFVHVPNEQRVVQAHRICRRPGHAGGANHLRERMGELGRVIGGKHGRDAHAHRHVIGRLVRQIIPHISVHHGSVQQRHGLSGFV